MQNDGTKCLERLNQSGVQTAKGQIETMSDSRQSKSKYTPGGEKEGKKKIRDNETVGNGRVLGQQEGIWRVLHFSAFTCLPPFQHIILVLLKFLYSARGIEYGNKTPLTQCECVIFCKIPLTNVFFFKYGYRSSIFLLYFSESAVLIHILQHTERFAGLSLPA